MHKKPFNLLILPSVENMRQVIDKFALPVKLTAGSYANIEMTFVNGQVSVTHDGVDLRNFSFVWLSSAWKMRDIAYAVRLYLERHGIPHTKVEKGTSKLTDIMTFALNGVAIPDTFFSGRTGIERVPTAMRKACGYPLIVKDTKGSRGLHSEYASDGRELLKKMTGLPDHKTFIFQRFIPNEYDWGIIVANGCVVSGEKSYPRKKEFRNNTCNGAREVFVPASKIPSDVKTLALSASHALGLAWSRTDIIVDKETGKYSVLEVNRLPGITSKSSEIQGAYIFLASQIGPLMRAGKKMKKTVALDEARQLNG